MQLYYYYLFCINDIRFSLWWIGKTILTLSEPIWKSLQLQEA